jgi:hypothetical protein
VESGGFRGNASRKRLQIQYVRDEFPTRVRGYVGEQGIISREQGIISAFPPEAGNFGKVLLRAYVVNPRARPESLKDALPAGWPVHAPGLGGEVE